MQINILNMTDKKTPGPKMQDLISRQKARAKGLIVVDYKNPENGDKILVKVFNVDKGKSKYSKEATYKILAFKNKETPEDYVIAIGDKNKDKLYIKALYEKLNANEMGKGNNGVIAISNEFKIEHGSSASFYLLKKEAGLKKGASIDNDKILGSFLISLDTKQAIITSETERSKE